MGALSTKVTRLDLRKWDIKLTTVMSPVFLMEMLMVFVEKECITHVESKDPASLWLSERNKIFFCLKTTTSSKPRGVFNIPNFITSMMYALEFCGHRSMKVKPLIIIIATASIEVLALLVDLARNNHAIVLKRMQKSRTGTNLEADYQVNRGAKHLDSSTVCVLISMNVKYQDERVDAILKQRALRGRFKCLVVGSAAHLTFPAVFLGSNFSVVKRVVEGNHFFCQDLKRLSSPTVFYSDTTLTSDAGKGKKKVLALLSSLGVFARRSFGIHSVASTVMTSNMLSMTRIQAFTRRNLVGLSILYFLNLPLSNVWFFQNMLAAKMLSFYFTKLPSNKQTVISYGNRCLKRALVSSSTVSSVCLSSWNYTHVPQKNFFANQESYFDAGGKIHKVTESYNAHQARNTWETFKKLYKHFKISTTFTGGTAFARVAFNSNTLGNARSLMWFHYFGCLSLTYLGSCLALKNVPFMLVNRPGIVFSVPFSWSQKTKMRYCSQDFFIGGSDPYCGYSKSLITCSTTKKSRARLVH